MHAESLPAPALPASAVLRVDLAAIAANWRMLAALAAPAVCAAVVKADAYGLGVARVAPALAEAGCRHFFVALLAEGVQLRQILGDGPAIYVLHGFPHGAEAHLLTAALIPVLNGPEQAMAWTALAAARLERLPAVLQLDTGMGRLGVAAADVPGLGDLSTLDLRLVMSHLACAADPADPTNAIQRERFRTSCEAWPGVPRSLAASAGIFLGRSFHGDMVRPGGSLYGLAPCPGANPMRRVVGLRAEVIQTRRLQAGEAIGYGMAWQAMRPTRVATLGIGYTDGIGRAPLAGRAAWFGEVALPLVGRVSMDSLMVDVSALPAGALGAGDWVEILGPHADPDALAQASGTIGWEVLARLGQRLARRYE